MVKAACEDLDLNGKLVLRTKNFFALGVLFYMYDRPLNSTEEWQKKKFAGKDGIIKAKAIQTGLDTIAVTIGAGSSTYGNDANPDYTLDSLSYFFTGDINVTGTKVQENGGDGYIDIDGSTFYRWGKVTYF